MSTKVVPAGLCRARQHYCPILLADLLERPDEGHGAALGLGGEQGFRQTQYGGALRRSPESAPGRRLGCLAHPQGWELGAGLGSRRSMAGNTQLNWTS